jgi:hypothetical protein
LPVPQRLYLTGKWSKCVGIEYRQEWGGIPASDEREAIADLVGFVVGRRLLFVSHTELGDDLQPTRASAVPPNTIHAETLCRMPDMPPVRLVHQSQGG